MVNDSRKVLTCIDLYFHFVELGKGTPESPASVLELWKGGDRLSCQRAVATPKALGNEAALKIMPHDVVLLGLSSFVGPVTRHLGAGLKDPGVVMVGAHQAYFKGHFHWEPGRFELSADDGKRFNAMPPTDWNAASSLP